jgi:coniferyl-aldehyde dehydrogenase
MLTNAISGKDLFVDGEDTQVPQNVGSIDLDRVFALQRAAYLATPFPSESLRCDRLQRLMAIIKENQNAIAEAIRMDFGNRSDNETLAFEILSCVDEIRHAIKKLAGWMKGERRAVGLTSWPGRARVVKQPLGVIGVIAPWNYPLYLAVSPMVGALAAGNRVIVKLSEYTPQFNDAFAKMVARTFQEDEVAIVTGGAEMGRMFSSKPFDHLLFTGSTAVGRQVMLAAAANLTPVTLELGGKSPTIIADDASLERVIPQILFGKLANSGQTCVAPDYVLLPRGKEKAFVEIAKETVKRFYPSLEQNADYTCVVNERQAQRLRHYIENARSLGATIHPLHDEVSPEGSRKFTPMVVTGVTDRMLVMQEEIFGPLLPLVVYDNFDQAIQYVNQRPRPLALYLFTKDRGRVDQVLNNTISGGVVINDVMMHVIQNDLPFGGVGTSGMGHYHGKEGFDTFSKLKGVFYQSHVNGVSMLYPPRDKGLLRRMVNFLLR